MNDGGEETTIKERACILIVACSYALSTGSRASNSSANQQPIKRSIDFQYLLFAPRNNMRLITSFIILICANLCALVDSRYFAPTPQAGVLYLRLRGGSTSHVSASASSAKQIQPEDTPESDQCLGNSPKVQSLAVQSISVDQHDRLLMLIRVLFLCFYGSLGSLMPYLPVYYQSLGHGGLIIGLLGSIKPLTTFFVAPIWGFLSDQSGENKFNVLKITFMVSLLSQLVVPFRNDVKFLMTMVFVTAIVNAPVKSLIDSFVMDHLSEADRTQYGKLRLWGQLGFGIGSSGAGLILSKSLAKGGKITTEATSLAQSAGLADFLSKNALHLWDHLRGYKLLFALHALLAVPTWLCLREFHKMDGKQRVARKRRFLSKPVEERGEEPEPVHIVDGIRALLTSSDAMLFFFLVFVVGLSSGCIENFAYVRMREVGGSGKEMGISRLVSSVAGAPMFYFSGSLTERLGADRVLVLSLLSYVCRFFIYAAMKQPYHGLPAEALRGVTFGAFWSTGTVYAHRIAPHGMHATMVSGY